MGQQSSSNIQEIISETFNKLDEVQTEKNLDLHICKEMLTVSYDDFLAKVGKLNKLSKTCSDSSGKHLIFVVKKGSDVTVFWKATIQIACVKLDPVSQKLSTYRLLNFKEFIKVFNTLDTLKCQCNIVEDRVCSPSSTMSLSTMYPKLAIQLPEDNVEDLSSISYKQNDILLDSIDQNECCICFERRSDVLLPCAHSYCRCCFEEWSKGHKWCPTCRAKLDSTEDTWVLEDIPGADEISEEIRSNLIQLANQTSNEFCHQS